MLLIILRLNIAYPYPSYSQIDLTNVRLLQEAELANFVCTWRALALLVAHLLVEGDVLSEDVVRPTQVVIDLGFLSGIINLLFIYTRSFLTRPVEKVVHLWREKKENMIVISLDMGSYSLFEFMRIEF